MQEMRITDFSWGNMEVTIQGRAQRFKDCKLWPGGARAWDWSETGTRHAPGIQPADLEELLEKDPEALVLGVGVFGRLGVCPEAEDLLRTRGVPLHIEKTGPAVRRFNVLAGQGVRVAGLFHSTC